jgi:ABC-type branched-subunit amino acid transport system ATPase component/ABC-type branched-subunit amino acid transport system permease subunit
VTAFEAFGWDIPLEIVVLGAIIGASYGLLAVGLVLVHRSSSLVNFAHAEVGAFAATILYIGVNRWDLPYYLVLPGALAVAVGLGMAVEGIVVGRLGRAPASMSIVATLGVAQLLAALAAALASGGGERFAFPAPPGMPTFDIGNLRLTGDYSATLILAPILVAALALFLARTRAGLRVRATAANRDAARLAGIPAARISRLVWALAGLLAAMTAILTAPSKGPGFAAALGPGLLLRGLAPALVARMRSLPVALGAGVVLGIVEQIVFWNQRSAQNVDAILFAVILVALLLQRQRTERDAGHAGWAGIETWRPLATHLRTHPRVRLMAPTALALGVAFAALVPLLLDRSRSITLSSMVGYAVIGIALGLITGLAGQLSLGHFAIGAIAGTSSVIVANQTANFGLGLLTAAVVGGAVSLLIGLPVLRARGMYLAVTSLALAVATTSWLLPKEWMLGDGREPPKPVFGGLAITGARSYYWFVLAIGVVVFVAIAALRRGGFGRVLIALRDGEDVAESFGIAVPRRKVQAFVVSGIVAGIGGALYAHTFARITVASFPASASIDIAVMVVVGGATLLAGPLVGVLFVVGVPAFLPLDAAGLATTKLGLLLLIVYLPGGFAQLLLPLRDRLAARLAGAGTDPHRDDGAAPTGSIVGPATAATERAEVPATAPVVLSATGLTKHYGGVRAVQGASLHVRSGEIVGLIGPNGAGKTTLFEMLTGFTPADAGTVVLDGRDVTRLGPSARANAGLVRTFQNSPLFPTLTVVECIATALERSRPTRVLTSLVGWSRPERQRTTDAIALAERFGLGTYLDHQIKELSTGTRRICELACITALAPRVLLLDEPAAGLAQREVEALVPVLRTLRAELDCTMIVIEHDLPMLTLLADRMVAMVAGEIVAEGSPATVTGHPVVVAAYLGEREVAVERSGAPT